MHLLLCVCFAAVYENGQRLGGLFNFTFETGRNENLIVNLTKFVDSKVYAGGD